MAQALLAAVLVLSVPSGDAHALEPGAPLASYVVRQWTDAEGLPLNTVHDIVQTRDGHLWLATAEGLARFDGVRFTVFDSSNTPAIHNNLVWDLLAARDGSLWIATNDGLVRRRDGAWKRYSEDDGLWHSDVGALAEDASGTLWIATPRGLNALEPGGRLRAVQTPEGVPTDLRAVEATADGSVWVGSATGGLVRCRNGRFTRYTTRQGLPDDEIWVIRDGGADTLWVGTRAGLARYEAGRFTAYTTDDGLGHDTVVDLHRDHHGTLWAGTLDGTLQRLEGDRFVRYPASHDVFGTNVQALGEDHEGNLWIGTEARGAFRLGDALISTVTAAQGLTNELVGTLYEDRAGRVWIGTLRGLSWLPPGEERVRAMQGALSSTQIRSVYEDRAGRLWVAAGTELRVRDGGRWRSYSAADGLADARGLALLEDRAGRLWIGTPSGLTLFVDETFTHYTSADGLPGEWVHVLHESRDGTLWAGTTQGISTVRVRDGEVQITTVPGLSHDHVLAVHEQDDGTLWIGTHGGGINRLRDGRFQAVRAADGLCDDVVFTILEDDFGNFWTSSNRGICRVSREELTAFLDGRAPAVHATAYGVADGMASRECNGRAGWRGRDGRLWFGTTRGAAVVDPRRLNRTPPPVIVQEVDVGRGWTPAVEGLRVPREASRDVRIRFAAASFRVPEKVRFRYRLEGRDTDWTEAEERREVTYAGLPPGEYAFHVIAANNDGVWNERGATLSFVVEPRFVETTAFRVLIAAAVLALALGAYGLRSWQLKRRLAWLEGTVEERTAELKTQKAETEEALETVRRQRREIEALAEARTRFFANVSHELRTPLTLLVGPLGDQLRGAAPSAERTEAMMRNARRLERLVEQLLDLERLDAGQLPSRPVHIDLVGVTRDAMRAFAELAEREGVELEAELDAEPIPVHVDVDHVGRVLGNLLSNAVKFTPRGGRVRVTLDTVDSYARLTVDDTGPGIPPDWRERIFDRFSQMGNRETQAREGAGLGLALCRELVHLHQGQLHVEEGPDGGARFVLRLPLTDAADVVPAASSTTDTPTSPEAAGLRAGRTAATGEDVRVTPAAPGATTAARAEAESSEALHVPFLDVPERHTGPSEPPPANGTVVLAPETATHRVLIAEDNPDLRHYIQEILAEDYETEAVEDGEAALAAVWREPPDVIVSDVVMPRRDGFALARALRAEPDFAGIPLIFLTARAGDADRIKGLAIGADQYLRKPFRSEVLKAHIAAALRTCLRLRDQLARQAAQAESVASAAPGLRAREERDGDDSETQPQTLPERVRRWIEANAHEDSLNVDDLAAALNMSAATLRRKLRAATGMSPVEFIRTARLARARALLQQAAGNVSEVAYAVGFNSLAAFSRAYRSTYGEPPSRALRST